MTGGAVSFWLETAGDDLTPRPSLAGSRRADVVVVGAGFTGLWTAWELVRRDPALDVVVLEAEIAGFGASGRNGGWCVPALGVTPRELARRTSPVLARRTIEVLRETVTEIGALTAAAGLDVGFRRGGILRIARGRHEVPVMHARWQELEQLDLLDGHQLLDAAGLRDRVRASGAHGGIYDPHGAVVHPGRLVRGLAHLVESAGGVILERSRVTEVRPGPTPRVVTDHGVVVADTVVVATEAWLSQLPGHHRDVLPVYSLIVLTEPVPDELAVRIGWRADECLSSFRYTVDYLSRTEDGRVLFGGRGAPYHFGSGIRPAHDRHAPTHDRLRRLLADWFPELAGLSVTHAWGGPLGMPRDFLPSIRHDPAAGVAMAYGYTGQGVAASRLAGRVLADLVITGETPLEDLPMVNHRPRRWAPEPLRWLGARYVQAALTRIDRRAARTGRAPTGRSLAERLVRH